MPKAPLFNSKGERLGEVDLPEAVFGIDPNEHAVHEAVVMQLASRRAGTHDTKTISEVSGGGHKPWRQKGTGRARQGSRRSPLWRGGGIVFGPTPREYAYSIPRKVRRLALLSALSSRALANSVYVVDSFDLTAPSTKRMVNLFRQLNVAEPLVVTSERNEMVERSARNVPNVKVLTVEGLNVYDIMDHVALIMTQDAVQRTEEAFA
ncbi:MAG: 50S ribosomal protein L4 [Firmicutes bacterium]|nr:50S ribosomal protein L4 [Bacillota bacterium]